MKKLIIIALIMALAVLFILPASLLAHPVVPPQSVGNVNANAAMGMHTAYGNVTGIAAHVFEARLACHPLP